jgi:hypothetical protein
LLATLPTPCPALLALLPTPPTAFRTASTGVLPPLAPLREFELGDFDLAFDFELDGFARFADFAFGDFDFAALGFEAFAFDFAFGFDCDFAFDFEFDFDRGFDFDLDCDFGLLDEPALFDAGCSFALVSAIFLSPRGCP